MPEIDYHEQEKQKNILHLRELAQELPSFMNEFFRGISDVTSPKTRIAYAYDMKIFFTYIVHHHVQLKGKQVEDLEIADLEKITPDDFEMFMEYITFYVKVNKFNENEEREYKNKERGKARKVAAIRAVYAYFFKKRKIATNFAELIEMPKIHEKSITRLEVHEVAKLIDEIESGEHLTERQKKYHKYTQKRDLALIMLLLGTGIRVSECVGININHIDFELNGIKITRKGGNQVVIYFGNEVRLGLEDYLEERRKLEPKLGHEDSLFLSMQYKRLTVRAIQNLVKKYSKLITIFKNISPHKLRSTYGTNLYRETGDIYLVADVLGHKDVNTTRKHYAQIDDDRRKKAATYVKLREN